MGVTIPDAVVQPTMTVEEAGKALGISRSTAYDAVHSGEIPSIRLGRRLVVPTAAVRNMVQLDQYALASTRGGPEGTWREPLK